MPVVLQRLIQKIKPDKWDALDAIDKKFDAVKAKYKFPPKKRYRAMFGPLGNNILVIEKEWKSITKMEEATLMAWGDLDEMKLTLELNGIVEGQWNEVYITWPLKV